MKIENPRKYIETAEIAETELRFETKTSNTIDLAALPDAVVSGTTLVDLANVREPQVRSGVSLAMLFASRVAENSGAEDPDSWLAAYQSALSKIGFSISGSAVTNSTIRKTNVAAHKALIPFLTTALGGAAAGPVLLALLNGLQEIDADAPWITLFNRMTRRFDVSEMHFATALDVGIETEIRYAVARLEVDLRETQILFFRITKNSASFESLTTSMRINDHLVAMTEPLLASRLADQASSFIWEAKISGVD